MDTRDGPVNALWVYEEDGLRLELETPIRTRIRLKNRVQWVNPGKYTFWIRTLH